MSGKSHQLRHLCWPYLTQERLCYYTPMTIGGVWLEIWCREMTAWGKVVGYFDRQTTKHEQKYHPFELEVKRWGTTRIKTYFRTALKGRNNL
jgi:hypothetical protein